MSPSAAARRKRVGVVGLWHETNTYSSRRPTLADFADFELLRGEEISGRHRGNGTVIGGMLEARSTFDPVPVFSAGAWPSGPASPGTLDELLDLLNKGLSAAGRLDGLLFDFHGAMVCEGTEDAELAAVRLAGEVVGEVPMVAVHDLHGNPSPGFVGLCDAIVAYDTYPHVDMRERGQEAAALMKEVLGGRELRTAVGKVPLLSCPLAQATVQQPMRGLIEGSRQLAEGAGVRRVSLLPGFPYSDVERAGFSVLAVHDEERRTEAGEVVARLCAEIEARKEEFSVRRDGPDVAVRRALGAPRGPVVLADVADNIGAGGPGDGTAILAELLAQGARGAVVLMVEPALARSAARLAPGAAIEADVGARTDDLHGSPV
ncbi:MAG: M81 family metallopeptidase, partial [Actinomycetota bacterium]|nr:M81 family metallopeptidase [Actinomycetota bacterium]